MAEVLSVNSSLERGTPKYPVTEGRFIRDFGMEGDAHAGNWHRQVCIFDISSMDSMSEKDRTACEETYSENITTSGIQLHSLPIGTKLKIADALVEITQIGKDFVKDPAEHTPREIIMHKEGIFCIVLKSGFVRPGDSISIID